MKRIKIMRSINICNINEFTAIHGLKKKDLADTLNVSRSQISFYTNNNYFVIYDNSGHCEIIKTVRRFNLNNINLKG